jgi:PAS domain S-box-containing protein
MPADEMNEFARRTARYTVIFFGLLVFLVATLLVLDALDRRGLVSSLIRDIVELSCLCLVILPLFLFLRSRKQLTTFSTSVSFFICTSCILLIGVLDVTDAIPVLDDVLIIGSNGFLHRNVRNGLEIVEICAFVATLYFLLVSLERSNTQLRVDAGKMKEEIADRERAEVSLRESEAKYQQIFEATSDGLVIADGDGVIVEANAAACRIHGYSYGDLIGLRPADIIDADYQEQFCELASTIREGLEFRIELTNVGNGGTSVDVEVHGTTISYKGRPHTLCVLRDVTERMQIERELRNSERKFRGIFEAKPECVKLLDADGNLLDINPAGLAMIEAESLDQVRGQCVYPIIAPEYREAAIARTKAVFGGEPQNAEFEIVGLKGTRRWIESHDVPLTGPDGDVAKLLVVARDITERKRALELAEKHREELVHVSRLNTMGEMASGMAHELNQPLAAISMFAETCLIKMKSIAGDEDELTPILQKIRDQTVRIGQIIHRLRKLVKKEPLSHETIRVDEIFDEVLMLLNSELRGENVAVNVQLPDDLPAVRGDTIQLEQVVLNLVRNAAEAMKGNGSGEREIVLQASASDRGNVEIEVRDTGPGMSEDAVSQVFDAFFTTKSEGMGMGLAICRSIIEAHGGKISAAPNADRGATFRIVLPEADEEGRDDI